MFREKVVKIVYDVELVKAWDENEAYKDLETVNYANDYNKTFNNLKEAMSEAKKQVEYLKDKVNYDYLAKQDMAIYNLVSIIEKHYSKKDLEDTFYHRVK